MKKENKPQNANFGGEEKSKNEKSKNSESKRSQNKNKTSNAKNESKGKQNITDSAGAKVNAKNSSITFKNRIVFMVVAFLTAALIIGLAVGVTVQTVNLNMHKNHITLTKPITVQVKEKSVAVGTIFVPSGVVGNYELKQPINFVMPDECENLLVRARILGFDNNQENFNVTAITKNNWTMGEDGYYYLNDIAKEKLQYNFATTIKLPKFDNLNKLEKTLTVVYETIVKNENNALEKWNNAPQSWVDIINNL